MLTVTQVQAASLTITDSLIDRFGTLIIIVLGEIVTGVVTGLASRPISPLTLSVGLVAVVVGFGAWWTYFDFAGRRPPRQPGRHPSVDARPPAADSRYRGDGRRDGQPRRPRPRGPHPGRHGLGAVRGRGRRAGRDDGGLRQPASLGRDRGLYRPLARTCAAAAAACLVLGAVRPAPLVLGLALIILLSIPWGLAVTRRLASGGDAAAG